MRKSGALAAEVKCSAASTPQSKLGYPPWPLAPCTFFLHKTNFARGARGAPCLPARPPAPTGAARPLHKYL